MRILNTLNNVSEKMSNANFTFIKNWADAISRAFDIVESYFTSNLSDSCRFTDEGGIAIRVVNGTGSDSVKGSLVSASSSVDNEFILQSNEYDTFGIVYENGIADGSACWVVISGVADVLIKNSTAITRGHVAIAADTDGRAISIAVPSSNPVEAQHFKEIGHFMESKNAGTDVLAKAVIHFN